MDQRYDILHFLRLPVTCTFETVTHFEVYRSCEPQPGDCHLQLPKQKYSYTEMLASVGKSPEDCVSDNQVEQSNPGCLIPGRFKTGFRQCEYSRSMRRQVASWNRLLL